MRRQCVDLVGGGTSKSVKPQIEWGQKSQLVLTAQVETDVKNGFFVKPKWVVRGAKFMRPEIVWRQNS